VPPSSRQRIVANERARQVLHKPVVNLEGSAHPSACASGRSILKIWYGIALVLVALSGSSTHADRVGYHKVADLSAETDAVRAEHHHDWSSADDARGEIFTEENHYSYLQLREKATGAVLFRRPGPALSHIWISPDSKYVVGISNIKLWNPYQLVVYSKSGDRLLERDIVSMSLPGASESVTNWIDWYREPVPKIAIVENGTTATLSIEGRLGGFHQFQFPVVK
jgi:hypothetical protein